MKGRQKQFQKWKHIFYYSPNITGIKNKSAQSEACVGERRNKRKIYAENLKERDRLEDLDRDRRIVVQRVSH